MERRMPKSSIEEKRGVGNWRMRRGGWKGSEAQDLQQQPLHPCRSKEGRSRNATQQQRTHKTTQHAVPLQEGSVSLCNLKEEVEESSNRDTVTRTRTMTTTTRTRTMTTTTKEESSNGEAATKIIIIVIIITTTTYGQERKEEEEEEAESANGEAVTTRTTIITTTTTTTTYGQGRKVLMDQ
ncbi:hypothetical protein JD844_028640 [Phrynosoma platyrhinos]|uniref:Uncharacterized protein n=1 Tax=Phrynosoma platyrhinos TaxID=52577 RepID=A0ABQ7SI96_PHRPL|nr:hypothetical protein JD844_028640 [Phrynosoma platyrhinos]